MYTYICVCVPEAFSCARSLSLVLSPRVCVSLAGQKRAARLSIPQSSILNPSLCFSTFTALFTSHTQMKQTDWERMRKNSKSPKCMNIDE